MEMAATPAVLQGMSSDYQLSGHLISLALIVLVPPSVLVEEDQKLLVNFFLSGQHLLRVSALY